MLRISIRKLVYSKFTSNEVKLSYLDPTFKHQFRTREKIACSIENQSGNMKSLSKLRMVLPASQHPLT